MGKHRYPQIFASRLVLALFVTFALCACREQSVPALKTSEVFFDETLASISPDCSNPDIFYVGTEDGLVYVYDASNATAHRWNTPFDRIYKVVGDTCETTYDNAPTEHNAHATTTHDGATYWVGTRNMGVVRCRLQGDSLVMQQQYPLPSSPKGTRYSTYDILVSASGIYAATSHGLFHISRQGNMTPVFNDKSCSRGSIKYRPFVVSDLRELKGGDIVCVTPRGVIRINADTRKTRLLTHSAASSISLRNDTITCLCADTLITLGSDGREIHRRHLPYTSGILYDEPSTKMNYLIDGSTVQLLPYDDGSETLCRATIPRHVRTFCHNIIANDMRRSQSLLVTEHALLRIGHHQDILSNIGNVKHAFSDGKSVYYLVGKQLFRQDSGENKAVQLKDLTRGSDDVRFITILKDTLYYADSNNRIFKSPLYSDYLLNSILSWDRKIKNMPDCEITAMGNDGRHVYVGIRDGIMQLDNGKDLKLNSRAQDAAADSEPFVTAISLPSADGSIYLATLNDGIFKGKNGTFSQLPASVDLAFVRDVAVVSGKDGRDSLFVLTNHRLLCGTADSLQVCNTLTAMRRLAVAGSRHIYGFPDCGVIDLNSSRRYMADIHFNPKACIVVDGRVYAGSSAGVYTFGPNLDESADKQQGYTTVTFDRRVLFSRFNIGLLFVLILIGIAIGWYSAILHHAKRCLLTRVDKLDEKLEKIGDFNLDSLLKDSSEDMGEAAVAEHIKDLRDEIEHLSLATIRTNSSRINKLNVEIQNMTLKLPSLVNICLTQQTNIMRENKWEGYQKMINDTESLMNDSIEIKAERMKINNEWIAESRETKRKYDLYLLMPEIEGVAKVIHKSLTDFQKSNSRKATVADIVENADKLMKDANTEGLAQKMAIKADELVCSAKDIYNGMPDDVARSMQKKLLGDCLSRTVEMSASLHAIGSQPLPGDALLALVAFSNTFYRLKAAMAVCETRNFIDNILRSGQPINKASVYKDLTTFVSDFVEAIGQCQDKAIFKAIGLSQKKDLTNGHYVNENMLVLLLAMVEPTAGNNGEAGMKIGISDQMTNEVLSFSDRAIMRSRRQFCNLTAAKLDGDPKGGAGKTEQPPVKFLEQYSANHPESFGWLLLHAVKALNINR